MAFTKIIKQVEYNVQIIQTFGLPQSLLADVRDKFVNEGRIGAIKELRMGFEEHYKVQMGLKDAKEIVDDLEKEFGLKAPPLPNYSMGEPNLGDILAAALRKDK